MKSCEGVNLAGLFVSKCRQSGKVEGAEALDFCLHSQLSIIRVMTVMYWRSASNLERYYKEGDRSLTLG